MPNFVWTAKDVFGKPVVRTISAASAEEARSALIAEGLSEIVLVGDEVIDAATSAFPQTTFLGQEIRVTDAERLKHRGNPPATFARVLWRGMLESKGLLLPLVALAAFEIYRGNKLSLILIGGGLVAWLAFLLVVGLPSIYYRRLHKAADWYRWTEVLSLVDTLDQIGKFHFIKLPPAELARFRAKALAGSGRLSEALAEYACFENQPGCPTWLYLAMVAGIYDTAKQHDKAVEFTLKSIRENPRPTIYIDLANRYARYQKNPSKAREALAEAEKSPLVDLALPFQHRCRGIVAFLEGDDSTARLELETSLRILQKAPNLPFRDGTISVTKAYLCRVLSRQGDQVAARKYLAEAKAYLVATGEDELLEACQRDTGLMTSDNAARIAWKP